MRIPLTEAVDRFKREPGALSAAYATYRRHATQFGTIWLGAHRIAASKEGRQWTVAEADLEDAVSRHREQRAHADRMTADYDLRILHPGTVPTVGGGYEVKGGFHILWNDMAQSLQRSNGFWLCNTCWVPAATERNREECHRCQDWSWCGNDCTLSRIYCSTCGASETM